MRTLPFFLLGAAIALALWAMVLVGPIALAQKSASSPAYGLSTEDRYQPSGLDPVFDAFLNGWRVSETMFDEYLSARWPHGYAMHPDLLDPAPMGDPRYAVFVKPLGSLRQPMRSGESRMLASTDHQ